MNKKLEEYTKEDLIQMVKNLKGAKKFGLVWEDKPEKVVELCYSELPVLEEVAELTIKELDSASSNLILEGDNYHSLSALNYTHAGKVDFIYVDPPYNTGARDWRYNNDYVDDTDTFRHSKWLSFMAHRLRLAKNLLTDDGVICVTIDDYEMPRLWILLEEIFGYENHLGTVVIRNNPKGRMTRRKFSLVHEYGLFFGKSPKSTIKKLPENPSDKTHNYKQDTDGSWYLPVNLRKQGVDSDAYNKKGDLSHRYYPIYYEPKTGAISVTEKYSVIIDPVDSNGTKRIWRRGKEVIEDMYNKGDLWMQKTANGYQLYFKFRGGLDGKLAQSIWSEAHFSASDYGTKILDSILGERERFQYPKAPEAVKQSILSATNKKDALVLDFFAGSGTTGHAVIELNKEDGGNRKFILCTNNENKIAEEVTYRRMKNVIKGYGNIDGIPANLRYFKTSSVSKQKTDDQTRLALIDRCTDLIRVREDAYDYLIDDEKLKLLSSDDHNTAIIFDPHRIDEFFKKIEETDHNKPLNAYIFSYSSYTYDEDIPETKLQYTLCPIPESILEVYRRIFREEDNV
jgi:adenine-specific DNA-methyltransferase